MFCRHIKCPINIALLHFIVRWQAHISGEDKDKETRNGILWQTEVLRNVRNVSMKEVSNNKTKSDPSTCSAQKAGGQQEREHGWVQHIQDNNIKEFF